MRTHGRRVPIHLPPTTVYSDSQLEVVSSASNSLASDYVFQGRHGRERSLTKTSRTKKQFQRAPGLQAALDRIQQRRAQDEPSVLLKDDEPKEMGQLLELFSKYDTILDHLVKKNEGLKTYAHGETEEQSFTTMDVLETLEELRMKREQTLGHHDETTAYDRSRSHSRSPHIPQIVDNRKARNRVSQQQRYQQSHLSPLSTETYSNSRIIPREIQVEGREPSMQRERLPDRHSRSTNIASERFPSRVESRSASRYTSDASKSLSQHRYDMDSEVQILGESKPRQFKTEKRGLQAWQGDPLSRPRRESPYDEKVVPTSSARFPNDTKPRYGAAPSHTLGPSRPAPGRSKSEARDEHRQTTSRWGHNRKNTALRDPTTSPSRASSPPQVTFNRRMDPASREALASRQIRDLSALRRQQVADRRAGSQERPIIDVKSDGFSLGLGAARRQLVAESRFESQERPIVDVESEDFVCDLDYWRRQKVVGNDKVYDSQKRVIDLSADEFSHPPLHTEESRIECLQLSPPRKEAEASNLPYGTIFADETQSEVSSLNPSEKARRLKSHVDEVYNYSRRLHSSQETLKGDLLDFKKRYHDRNESLYERALQSSGTANSELYRTEMGSVPERLSNFAESEDDRLRLDMEVSPYTPLDSRGYQSEKGARQPEDPAGRAPAQSRAQNHKAVLMREHAERISVALRSLKTKRKSARSTFASENTESDTSTSSPESSDWTEADLELYPIAQSRAKEYPDAPSENELIQPPKYNVRARLRGMRSNDSLVSSSDSVSTRGKTTGIIQKKVLSKVQSGKADKNTDGEDGNDSLKETSDDLTMPNLVLVDNSGACPQGVGKVMRWDAPCGVPCGLA